MPKHGCASREDATRWVRTPHVPAGARLRVERLAAHRDSHFNHLDESEMAPSRTNIPTPTPQVRSKPFLSNPTAAERPQRNGRLTAWTRSS